MGNLASVWHALHALQLRCRVSSEPAALDKTDQSEAISAKVLGSSDQQNKATMDRGAMRDVLGGRLVRELVLK